jgi:hypothetical protein
MTERERERERGPVGEVGGGGGGGEYSKEKTHILPTRSVKIKSIFSSFSTCLMHTKRTSLIGRVEGYSAGRTSLYTCNIFILRSC